MNPIRFFPAAVLAFVIFSASAHEGMHGPGAEFDADGDGELSLEEYTVYVKSGKQDVGAAAAKFAQLDLDRNGFLSSKEFILGLPKTPATTSP